MKVYVILQKNLKESLTNIYGVYSNKKNAKRVVDRLNSQNAYDPDYMEYDYVLESYEVNTENEEV